MKLLREPLLHFLALGVGLFVLFKAVADPNTDRSEEILITSGRVRHLVDVWEKAWQRPPTPDELDGLIEEYIREEVLYREALAMGLDRDDTIVRRRMQQKFEFLMTDLADAIEPTDEELRSYYRNHADQFRTARRMSFSQVYLNPDRRGDKALEDAAVLLRRLRGAGAEIDSAGLGDPLLLEYDFQLAREDDVASRFGEGFAKQVSALPVGQWAGPIESGFGIHLVLVRDRAEAELPEFDRIQAAVQREYLFAHRKQSSEAVYKRLREKYIVIREEAPGESSQAVAKARVP